MTQNGGGSWRQITQNLPDRYVVDIAVSPVNPDIVYLALSGFGTPHVFRSMGGGLWEDIGSGLPDLPVSAVAVDPLDHRIIYVGNDLGVWVSTDFGDSWTVFREGLPEAVLVMDLVITDSTHRLRAATHGNGVYERTLLPAQGKGSRYPRR
jgi:hypothetical protein